MRVKAIGYGIEVIGKDNAILQTAVPNSGLGLGLGFGIMVRNMVSAFGTAVYRSTKDNAVTVMRSFSQGLVRVRLPVLGLGF